ncbi:uncharacterized protein LOC109834044 isoform X2 [Asparagus officinalis]|uniref:uncharacterized protein LOC109834044 isoform X2 n=1 Tax=Asparagus officinalis TaxID=4686 RepID=UPI00098DFCE5|nr:uncharacterized protein LOC109834044 isoform X2 [Asparagus officinalis]
MGILEGTSLIMNHRGSNGVKCERCGGNQWHQPAAAVEQQQSEAYEEFKHVLLALIYHEKDQMSPVANEWSEKQRFDLAGLMASILRAFLQAYDPLFSMTLRYLISIHKVYCLRQGVSSPISDLTERLLFDDRDPPATPQESLFEAPPFDEVDIQALAHAVEVTRQGAIDSLRFAKGDLFQAFQNELCRRRLDVSGLDHLVHEYCMYRGIVDSATKPPSAMNLANSSSRDCSVNLDSVNCKLSDGETSVSNVDAICVQEANAESASMQVTDVEMRFASEVSSSHEDCSTSDANHSQSCSRRLRRRCHSDGRRRKRWRGRIDRSELTCDVPSSETSSKGLMTSDKGSSDCKLGEEQASSYSSSLENVNIYDDNKLEVVLEMKELANKGLAAEVVEEVNALDPDFFHQNPILYFQLKQVEFLNLVNGGDLAMALKVASTHLGPLAASNRALMKPLKETLLAVLNSNEAAAKAFPLSALATSLQVAIGRRLGIEEPQLMKVMRVTLHTHNEWFKLQMCKDRFEELLKIDRLKEVDAPMEGDGTPKLHSDNCTHGSSQTTICSTSKLEDGSSPSQVSSSEYVCDEGAILKVMEFLALPRADAIHLLMQNNGNAETVIQQIFS